MRDRADITKSHAIAQLTSLLDRGDLLHLIIRGPSRRLNTIVEVILPPSLHIGEYIGVTMDRPYVYSYKGVLLRKGQTAEGLIDDLSMELFGEPHQLRTLSL